MGDGLGAAAEPKRNSWEAAREHVQEEAADELTGARRMTLRLLPWA